MVAASPPTPSVWKPAGVHLRSPLFFHPLGRTGEGGCGSRRKRELCHPDFQIHTAKPCWKLSLNSLQEQITLFLEGDKKILKWLHNALIGHEITSGLPELCFQPCMTEVRQVAIHSWLMIQSEWAWEHTQN